MSDNHCQGDCHVPPTDGRFRKVLWIALVVNLTMFVAEIAGLLPILIGHGTGSEAMARIAAPLLSLFVLPTAYWLIYGRFSYGISYMRDDHA